MAEENLEPEKYVAKNIPSPSPTLLDESLGDVFAPHPHYLYHQDYQGQTKYSLILCW